MEQEVLHHVKQMHWAQLSSGAFFGQLGDKDAVTGDVGDDCHDSPAISSVFFRTDAVGVRQR